MFIAIIGVSVYLVVMYWTIEPAEVKVTWKLRQHHEISRNLLPEATVIGPTPILQPPAKVQISERWVL